jgi:septal ring factor EnvC (AmiA/AmiB activator)
VTDDFYDASGRAEVALLQLGKDAEIRENEVAVFPQEDAQRLIDTGFCRFEEYVYVRPLNDYSYLLLKLDERLDRVANDIRKVGRDIGQLQTAQANVQLQINSANDDQTNLREDLTRTESEAGKIADHASTLEKTWADRRNQLTQLFQQNLELHDAMQRRYEELMRAAPGAAKE